jgi:hypothetical protein
VSVRVREPLAAASRGSCSSLGVMNPPSSKQRLACPSRFELTVLYFLLGAHVVLASDAAIPSGWVMFALISFYAVTLWFVIRLALAAWQFRVACPRTMRWVESALILAVLVILHATPVGVAVRVYLSQEPLMEQVRLAQTREQDWHGSGIPCGLFTIQATTTHKDQQTVWIETVSGSRVLEDRPSLWGGILYCKQAQPPPFGEIRYQHLYGPWWVWLQDV